MLDATGDYLFVICCLSFLRKQESRRNGANHRTLRLVASALSAYDDFYNHSAGRSIFSTALVLVEHPLSHQVFGRLKELFGSIGPKGEPSALAIVDHTCPVAVYSS